MFEEADSTVQLFSAGAIPPGARMLTEMNEACTWAQTFLTQPHAELGRSGAVCPFTKSSLDKGLFWVGTAEDHFLAAESLATLMSDMASRFLELPGEQGKEAIFKTALILLPSITNYRVIDQAHELLKSDFISKGLMIGQFYPGCDAPGLWNPAFHPLDAPIPMLVVRHMVATDFPFLASRCDWVERYLRKFAPALPSGVRSAIVQQFDKVA
ncbi:DUF6875 domain-containing protein [Cryobacterium sp. MDB2-33-2]|uniref:DUF6875 domain-containing protein n=1 Tax=Cryobacterium sp. MDB2-33-2 TaxID=1259179 RepID=UPI00106CA8BC|nr:hypothetical protein [Cryobacterium sp. MDB2-33-2]TFC11084.1 hypothetical protein E3O59_02120 [Cryobacterium sp. MDB2-33-2]